MPGKHQGLQRKSNCLQANDQGVHQGDCINDMKVQPPHGTYVLVGEKIVIVGIGINDALATRWNTSETTLIERLKKDGERSRPRGLLRIDEQIRGLDLAGCDIVLDLC